MLTKRVILNLGNLIGFITQSGFLNGYVKPERNFKGFTLYKSFTLFDAGCEAAIAQSVSILGAFTSWGRCCAVDDMST